MVITKPSSSRVEEGMASFTIFFLFIYFYCCIKSYYFCFLTFYLETVQHALTTGEWLVDNNQTPQNIATAMRVSLSAHSIFCPNPFIRQYVIYRCKLARLQHNQKVKALMFSHLLSRHLQPLQIYLILLFRNSSQSNPFAITKSISQ